MTTQTEEIKSFEFGEPGQGRPGILFIHGWTSSPRELRFFAQKISQPMGDYWSGAWCLGPLLPGHGSDPEDLNNIKPSDFLRVASQALQELRTKCRSVYIVGMSFGGAIALQLAKTHDIKGLILMAPFIHLTEPTIMGIPKKSLVKVFPEGFKSHFKESPGIADPLAREDHYSYAYAPVNAIRNLFDSVEEFTQHLSDIHCPTLIFHSIKDQTSHFRNSTEILERISSEDRRLIAYHRSNHILSLDYDHAKMEFETRAWLKTQQEV